MDIMLADAASLRLALAALTARDASRAATDHMVALVCARNAGIKVSAREIIKAEKTHNAAGHAYALAFQACRAAGLAL